MHGETRLQQNVTGARHCRSEIALVCAMVALTRVSTPLFPHRLAASTELWRNLHQVLADPSWAAQAKETSRRGDANVKKAMDSVQEGVGSLDSASPPADAAERLAVYLRVLMGGVSGAA
eukprot:SAG31_NODE_2251_length_6082_cov_2.050643_4_plen_119_part_00